MGGVVAVLMQHHHIRNRQRMPLEICRMVHIECAVDVLQCSSSSQRRRVNFCIVCLVYGPASSLQAVIRLKTVIAGGIFITQLVDGKTVLLRGLKTCRSIFLYDDKVLITFNYKEGTQTVTFGEASEVASEGSGSDLDCIPAPQKRQLSKAVFFVLHDYFPLAATADNRT